MDSVLLKVQELSYSYHTLNGETPALDRVSFCLYRKEFLAIVGPSGCGKSTILSLIAGLLTPGSGGITFYGENGHQPGIGYMLQHELLFEWRNVWQNVTLGLEIAHKDTVKNLERVRRMLSDYGLLEFQHKKPSQLSGGMRQRAALIRTMALEPDILLLDEPFSALDAYLKWQVELELSDILNTIPCSTLFVTHNRDEVYRLCDTVSCMNRGKMEVMEPLKEFFQNPKTRTAAILSGCKNISAAERVDAHTLRAVDWGVTLHVKEREIADDIRAVGIRAHFLATVERPGEENVFPVNESEIWEDPFEWNISFRKNAECSWLQWKIAKTDWSPEMGIPKELYLKEEDILLLTDS